MLTYVINIVTVAKAEDAYNEVATNLYPIIIRTFNEDTLKEHIRSLAENIKKTLKSKYLYHQAHLCIRTIEDDQEFRWKLSDVVKLQY